MFKIVAFAATLVASAVASIPGFPSFDFSHANCAIDVTYAGQTCSAVYAKMGQILDGYQGGDPGAGIYAYIDRKQDTYFWMTRTTPVHKYVDDIGFEFIQSGSNCVVKSLSRSQSLSYYDYSTNYCNMWNPLHYTGAFTNESVHDCKFPADDPVTICNKY